jgi:hypothetical protein
MGKIQIKVLAVLQHEPAPLDAIEIAALVYGINPCSAAAIAPCGAPSGSSAARGWPAPAAAITPTVAAGGGRAAPRLPGLPF